MSIDEVIGRFDWGRLRTYVGAGEMLPALLRGLLGAASREDARRLSDAVEHIVVPVASGPCEATAPVATVLVASLGGATPAGRTAALGLLADVGAAEICGPPHEQIGPFDLGEIRACVAAGFEHYVAILRAGAAEVDLRICVDLVELATEHDPGLIPAADAALAAIRNNERGPAA
ncbi:hypothetical protein ACQP00_15270 [Dactylosporangium sp. CS-047395]|uniref:hypothetical protein n=1 Tax=Dactylosporangium sp. CS-047395 TaxID=3239936 RepID=UPI003D90D066